MRSFEWCSVDDCRSLREEAYESNGSNGSNFSCPVYPFCVLMLTTTISHTQ